MGGPTSTRSRACCIECLTGSCPFPKNSDLAIISAHLFDPPPRPTELRPELPAAIDVVVATGMAKSPQGRYSTCSQLIVAAHQALAVPRSAPAIDRSATRSRQRGTDSRLGLLMSSAIRFM
jgi:hypothetical protein